MSKTVKLDWEEAKEIADVLTKTENPDEDYSITENALADKWSISLDDFHEIVDGIFRMIDFGISPLTQTPFVGISKGNEWLAKKEVNQRTIHGVVCCGVLEKMNLGWMKLEDGTKCMPHIKSHSDEVMYRVNNCPSCGKYVRDVMI